MASRASGSMNILEEDLYEAVNRQDLEGLKQLLRQGANVNNLVHSGRTILGRAVQLGNIEVIQTLINAEEYLPEEEEVNMDEQNEDEFLDTEFFAWDEDPLSFSCTESYTVEVKNDLSPSNSGSLSVNGNFSNPSCNDHWPIPPKPTERALGLFQTLRKYTSHRRSCDVNLPDFYDRMPVHYASELGNPEVLAMLLKAGCRVNVSDSESVTPLHLAVCRGHEEVTEMLLKAGSRVNSKTSDKSTALHVAASRGFPTIVDMLLNSGAKIDVLDSSDRTPLFLAVNRANHDVVRLLVKRGARVNVEEIHGYTPLAEAVWYKDVELVDILLKGGAKVIGHHHLLHYCVMHRCPRLTRLLLQAGSFVNSRDDSGDTPLHLAVRASQVEIIEDLLAYGGDVKLTSGLSGQTLIHEAVDGIRSQEFDTFRVILHLLMRRGSKLNVESFTPGDTPLYRAILLDKFRFAEELIRCGSDVNMGNVYSCNIDNLCLARRKNHFHTVRLLVFAGFHLWQTPWLEILPPTMPHSYPINTIKKWLIYMKSNPMNLSDLSRIVVRRRLGENLVCKINHLLLPERIKRYLLLEDVIDDMEASSPTADVNNANQPFR
ncbi:ankyrin-1-like isoform X2 [Limulus polyphemus]|uniref:Ankyrin-1-like isoform X2 n=1 Tax=Limulus polyphemus TaxID=6850 RepID=A0ABM1BG01_LIMPO|nr:ankyrin-1-like isoform X2 [Limulus polyphemus]